jgi:hypothetical protein
MPFYDLGLQGDDADAFVHRERLAMAVRLGYDCVATSHQASERLTDKDRQGLPLPRPLYISYWYPHHTLK